MNTVPLIVKVETLDALKLKVSFRDGTVKMLDITPYLSEFSAFKKLSDKELFNRVHIDAGGYGIAWNDEIDLSRYDIWEFGITQ